MFTIAITRCPTDPRPRQIIRRTCSRLSTSAPGSRILWQNPHNRSKKLKRCNRHNAYHVPTLPSRPVNRPRRLAAVALRRVVIAVGCAAALIARPVFADQSPRAVRQVISPQDQAALLVQRTIERLALGDAFDAKLRQRIWVGGREVTGIGHYEQSGGGTGRFSLEMTVHDGDARQSIRQISDGKLAWVRTQLGAAITLRRVDLGRIDEVYRELARADAASTAAVGGQRTILANDAVTPPWMRVGGLVELVDQIARDYDLRVGKGTIDKKPVWIVRGVMSERAWSRIEQAGDEVALCPFEVQLAIAAAGDAAGFGAGLPVQIEFYSRPSEKPEAAPSGVSAAEPPTETPRPSAGDAPRGRLISLLEVYALRRIQPSPEERFRYKGDEPDVTFSNDTRIYLDRLMP